MMGQWIHTEAVFDGTDEKLAELDIYQEDSGVLAPFSFKMESVDFFNYFDDNSTTVCFSSGRRFVVQIPYKELKRIYDNDD